MTDYIQIGKIVNTHGVKGHVKITPLTDYPERFKKTKKVLVEGRNGEKTEYLIEEVKYFKQLIILKFKGVEDMNSAELLKGLYLVIDKEDAVKLPKDTFYIFDLIGCDVYEGEEHLGKLKEVLETGSNDVYIVEYNGRELLIPALGWVVLSVNIESKRIEVKLPAGLREL